jgi:hypothetical protein
MGKGMNKVLGFDVNDLKGIMLALGMASDVMKGKTKKHLEQGSFGDTDTFMFANWKFNELIVKIGEFLPADVLTEEGTRVLETAKKNIKKFEALENEISQDKN